MLFIVVLSFFSASCKKENSISDDKLLETMEINGELFSVKETKEKLSTLLGIPSEELHYLSDSLGYKRDGYSGVYYVEPFIVTLKNMKN